MPYIARKYENQKDAVGNGECTTLVKEFSKAPAASLWHEGAKVSDLVKSAGIAEGTVIATFFDGHYPSAKHGNHAAIFIRATADGIMIFDQWKHHSPRKRVLKWGVSIRAGLVQQPERYSVVE